MAYRSKAMSSQRLAGLRACWSGGNTNAARLGVPGLGWARPVAAKQGKRSPDSHESGFRFPWNQYGVSRLVRASLDSAQQHKTRFLIGDNHE